MKILTIIGARPQFIKAAPLSLALKEAGFHESLIHTGQHYDLELKNIFHSLFSLLSLNVPVFYLNDGGKPPAIMLARMIEHIAEIILENKPDLLIVFGDTTSTLAGALAGAKCGIKIAHIESGLRSFSPMPEESNRILSDHLASYLFCPNQRSILHLQNENIFGKNPAVRAFEVGDIMLDAARIFTPFARKPPIAFDDSAPFIIATIHRAASVDDEQIFFEILASLEIIAAKIPVLFLTHPRNAKLCARFRAENILFAPPIDYLEMLFLLQKTSLVITDSGGLQKEAYFFGKRAIVVRESTEWQELVESGFHLLSPPNQKSISQTFDTILKANSVPVPPNLYGDGYSAEKIASYLKEEFHAK